MLKNVVLPAPFGPISDTTVPRGIVKSTSSVATSPPNSLRRFSTTTRSPFWLLMLRVVQRRVVDAFVELGPASRTRDQTFRPDQHREHDDRAVDSELVERHLEVRAERLVQLMADVRKTLLVEIRQERGAEHHAPYVAHPAEDDHRQDERGDVEAEVVRERRALERRKVGAGDTAEERARCVSPRLRAHEWDAHRGCGCLVFPDCDPGPAEARVAQPQAAEDRDRDEDEHEPEVEPRAAEERSRAGLEAGAENPRCVDRRDPVRAVGQVEAPEVVAVVRDLRQDLAETERHDREVVTA